MHFENNSSPAGSVKPHMAAPIQPAWRGAWLGGAGSQRPQRLKIEEKKNASQNVSICWK